MTNEEREQWTNVSGKVAAYDAAISTVKADAAWAFLQDGKEELADWLKGLAGRLEQQAVPLRAELHEFIRRGKEGK